MLNLISASLLTVGLMFALLMGVIMATMQALDVLNLEIAIGITIVINVVVFLINPWINDLILKWINGVVWWPEDKLRKEHPEIYELVQRICKEHGFSMPHFGYIDDLNPTAFTYGLGRNRARVVLTAGIFKYLSKRQVNAVVAHEMGHIRNYDFILMAGASLIVQVLYQLYVGCRKMLKKSKGSNSKNDASAAFIIPMVLAYAAYVVATYLLLYLSRTREYLADTFAASYTSAEDLAGALVRIAYGIVEVEDTDATHDLLNRTRHMGIVDVRKANQAGLLAANTNMDAERVAESMLFDVFNPWAKIVELSSTHPLTGNRLFHLHDIAKFAGQKFPKLDVHAAAKRVNLNHARLWQNFAEDVLVFLSPFLFAWAAYMVLPMPWPLIVLALGFAGTAFYSMPLGEPAPTNNLDLLCDPYASPVRGRPVRLEGKAVGRLDAGNFLDANIMLQQPTGLIPVLFQSWLGALGNLFVGFFRVKQIMGQAVTAKGWYYRGNSGYVMVADLVSGDLTIKSRPYASIILGTAITVILISWAGTSLPDDFQKILDYGKNTAESQP